MSTLQRIHARTVLSVDRETAAVLRLEAKKGRDARARALRGLPGLQPPWPVRPGAALSRRLRSHRRRRLGPDTAEPANRKRRFEVPLTEDLIDLLAARHEDLGLAVNDRIGEHEGPIPPKVLEEITTDRP
jgi:hypothetical protein